MRLKFLLGAALSATLLAGCSQPQAAEPTVERPFQVTPIPATAGPSSAFDPTPGAYPAPVSTPAPSAYPAPSPLLRVSAAAFVADAAFSSCSSLALRFSKAFCNSVIWRLAFSSEGSVVGALVSSRALRNSASFSLARHQGFRI